MQATRKAAPLRKTYALGLAALAPLGLAAQRPAAAQGLNGQSVNVSAYAPDTQPSSAYHDIGTATIPAAGFKFIGSFIATTVTPSQIMFSLLPNTGDDVFAPAAFNGLGVSEVGAAPANITAVTLDPATSLSGFDASRVSFDSTHVYANFEGLTFPSKVNVTLDLTASPFAAAVPEPSSFALLGLGLLPVGLLARRRKSVRRRLVLSSPADRSTKAQAAP